MPRARAAAKKTEPAKPISFLAFLEGSDFCALDLSPAVAAIAAASEGAPVDLDEATCRSIFGCAPVDLPTTPRRTVCVEAGGSGGKSSRLLATKALHAAVTVPCPHLRPGEKARSVIIAPTRDLADKVLDDVRGYVEESPALRRMFVEKESGKTRVRIRRPDGREVDIVVGAATRGARAVRGRRFVFVGMDEACFFDVDDGSAVTDREIYRAAIQRVLPGGQIWIVSTPWIAEKGLLEEKITAETITAGPRTGERKHENALTVARLSTRLMNPTWDEDGSIEADMRATDPENADREILAIPLSSDTSLFFDPDAINRMFDMPQFPGSSAGIGVGGDFGLTSDCSAVVATRKYRGEAGDAYDTFDAIERKPKRGEPLKPSDVFGQAADFTLSAGAKQIAADGHYKESVREHCGTKGVAYVEAPGGADGKEDSYLAARRAMNEGRWRCSIADPLLRARVKMQLRSITKKPRDGASAGIKISAPRMKTGAMGTSGGHGDLVSAAVLSLWRCGAGKVTRNGKSRKVHRGMPTRWQRGMMSQPQADARTGGRAARVIRARADQA